MILDWNRIGTGKRWVQSKTLGSYNWDPTVQADFHADFKTSLLVYVAVPVRMLVPVRTRVPEINLVRSTGTVDLQLYSYSSTVDLQVQLTFEYYMYM